MNIQHPQLAAGRWNTLPLVEQLAHVGSEVERAIGWKDKGNADYSRRAFERALELLDITIADEKNLTRLKELLRVREALADYFVFDNEYRSSDEAWRKYFYPFAFAVRRGR
jgi:hypothetical protein